ncbi:MAG: hypothetical protein EWM72_01345 [Nitrospira sp.]|nr:MAG: hypothetical protein EWM72_01345 [Nitrospira sp.]
MGERPAPIENRSPQVFRDVDLVRIGRAEGRYEEDKLQVRHPRILDIERLHDTAIIDRDLGRVNYRSEIELATALSTYGAP